MMNFGLPTSNWQCSPDMEFYQSSGFTRKRKNNIDVKCYRCGQIGHFREQCNSDTKKQKSMKNIARDKSRLQEFIRKKTCSHFPFYQLDDSQFQNTVFKFHFGLRLEVHNLNGHNDFLDNAYLDEINKIIRLKKEKADLKEELSTVKEQLKIAKDQLQEQKSIIRSLEEQTKSKLEELENERSDYRELCEKMDYKISLNKEIREWRKLCYEQSDQIQHYKSLELGRGSNHYPLSALNTTQRGHNHRQRGRRNPRSIGSAYRRGTIIPP